MSRTAPTPLQLAEMAYHRGDLAEVLRQCRQHLVQFPADAEAHTLLGITLARSGDRGTGIQMLLRALELDSELAEAHVALSRIYLGERNLEQAVEHAVRAIELQPDDPDLRMNLGLLMVDAKRVHEAIAVFAAAVEQFPDHPGLRQNLAAALRDGGRELDAVAAWEEVVQRDRLNPNAQMSLGQLYLAHGRFPEAIKCATRVLKMDSSHANAHLLKALALAENGEGEAAEPHLRKAIQLNPQDGVSRAALGFWYQEQGRFEEARRDLAEAIELNPYHGFAYYNYFRAKKATPEDQPQLDRMAELSENPKLHLRDRGYLHYALGKAYEDLKAFDSSMVHYRRGNECAFEVWLAHRPWDREEYAQGFDRTIELFTRERFEALQSNGHESVRPIFIIGMIRSGTSLLEQIVSSHPEITGAGELSFWHEHEFEGFNESGEPDPMRLRSLSEKYLAKLKSLSPDTLRVTDKLPHNYAMLGQIHAAMPHAKLIHVRRSPLDNCLSVYTTAYQRPPVFAHDPGNIGFAYREYQRIMAHWRTVISTESLLELSYEDLVADREGWTRRLIEFVGLPWDEACLHHESNQRSVRTPSLWQVRQPIYRTSIERWRNYAPWLPDFGVSA